MTRTQRLAAAFAIFAFYGASAFAQVAEDLRFGQSAAPKVTAQIEAFFQNDPAFKHGYDLAAIDLNEDAAPEFIVRSADCATGTNTLCPYLILALREDTIISLGRIEARKIALSSVYTNGVRSLVAFKNDVNDFAYDVYNWDANEQRFTN